MVLLGQMASGKSTVGAMVADALGWPLRDGDDELVARTGRSAASIQRDEGRQVLHAHELAILADLLAEDGPFVIAPAASVIEGVDVDRLRSQALVVWLRVPADVLADRAAAKDHRPLPAGADLREVFERLAARRDPRFAEAAHLVVDVEVDHRGSAARRIVRAAAGGSSTVTA